jgi:PAS domain-containing protein
MLSDRFNFQPSRLPSSKSPSDEMQKTFERSVSTEPVNESRPIGFSPIARQHGIDATAVDALLEQLPVAVLVADRNGRVVYANAEARTLRVERLERIQWAVTRALLTEDAVREDDVELLAAGQPRRWMTVLVTPLRTPGVGVHAAFVVVSDVTARKRMAEWSPVIETLVNL